MSLLLCKPQADPLPRHQLDVTPQQVNPLIRKSGRSAQRLSTKVSVWLKGVGEGFCRDLLGMEVKGLWGAGRCSWQHWRQHGFDTGCSHVLHSPSHSQPPKALEWLRKLGYITFLGLCSVLSRWALSIVPHMGLFTFILNIFLKDVAIHQFTPTLRDLIAPNTVFSQ